jgi:hypothetical protein
MNRFSTGRIKRILDLSNDLAEQMPMRRWTRKDLMDAIAFWQDDACENAQKLAALRAHCQFIAAKANLDYLERRQAGASWNRLLHDLQAFGERVRQEVKRETCRDAVLFQLGPASGEPIRNERKR